MPVISIFYGVIIRVYYLDHNPPHFHAQYGEHEVIIEIKTGKIINGTIPPRLMALIEVWRVMNQNEIMEAWNMAQRQLPPKKIKPLY